jgi:hypothetical protein
MTVPKRRWFRWPLVGIALLCGSPGIALALLAKPLVLGPAAMFLGLMFALGGPILWLLSHRESTPSTHYPPVPKSQIENRLRPFPQAHHAAVGIGE